MPWQGTLGVSFIQAAGQPTIESNGQVFDQARVLGADVNLKYRKLDLGFEFAMVQTLNAGSGDDLEDLNKAYDGKIGTTLGPVNLEVGGRCIERGFTAPGSWGRIGRWTNPTNILGPYVNANFGVSDKVKINASGAWYQGATNLYAAPTPGGAPQVFNTKDDNLWRVCAGVKWGVTPALSIGLDGEFVRWEPDKADSSDETYWTIGADWNVNPNTTLKLAYQIIDYSAGKDALATPYGGYDYKGNLAIAELGVKF